jgi:hypothetical protein
MRDMEYKVIYGINAVAFFDTHEGYLNIGDYFKCLVILFQDHYFVVSLMNHPVVNRKELKVPPSVINNLCSWWSVHRFLCDPHCILPVWPNPPADLYSACSADHYRSMVDNTLLYMVCRKGSEETIDTLVKTNVNYSQKFGHYHLNLYSCLLISFVNHNYDVLLYLLENCFKKNTFSDDFLYTRYLDIDNIIPHSVTERISKCSPDMGLAWPFSWLNKYLCEGKSLDVFMTSQWFNKNSEVILSSDEGSVFVFYILESKDLTDVAETVKKSIRDFNGLNHVYHHLV